MATSQLTLFMHEIQSMDVEANTKAYSTPTQPIHRYAAVLVLIALMAVGSIAHICWSTRLDPNCDQVKFLKRVQAKALDDDRLVTNRSANASAAASPAPLTKQERAVYDSKPMAALRREDPKACVQLPHHHLERKYIKDRACFTRRQVQRMLIELVGNASALFQQYGVTHWVDSGTFLGAIRHNGIIPYDRDADMGIDEAGYLLLRDTKIKVPEPYVLNVFNSTKNERGSRDPPLPIRLINKKSAMYVDVFVFYDAVNQTTGHHVMGPMASRCFRSCVRCPKKKDGLRHFQVPREWIFPLRQCDFEDSYVPCPREAHKYLDYLFGSDYMVPK